MSLSNFIINTSEITGTKWLSVRPYTCHFTKYEMPKFKERYCNNGFDILGKFVFSLRSGKYIPKENYSIVESDYVYLNVGNFSKGDIGFSDIVFLENEVGEDYKNIKVNQGDIVITRSGTVGKVEVFEIPAEMERKIFIPSHHLALINTTKPEDDLFLKYYLNYSFCKEFFDALSTGKVQKEITNWSIRNIPIPLSLDKKLLTRKFFKIDDKIKIKKKYNIPLQKSIDEVLSDFYIKSESLDSYRTTTLNPKLSNIGQNKALRIGSEYNDFWLAHHGHLFVGTNEDIEIVPLKHIVKLSPKTILKKGPLNEAKILVDFDQIESQNGRITNLENVVVELGSDRIEFGDCDFLTNKLRPYLGYTILNKPELPLVGTTEFIPFNVRDKAKAQVEYIRYLLLSNEYLEKSKFLMSGKEHPRINAIDIMNIKVPIPDVKIQKKIVDEISKRDAESQKARDEIKKLRSSIDDLIQAELENVAKQK